jgi:hypothetical protein
MTQATAEDGNSHLAGDELLGQVGAQAVAVGVDLLT